MLAFGCQQAIASLVKIWTLKAESVAPEIFNEVKQEGAETLASLRVCLETEEVLDWDFDFWAWRISGRLGRRWSASTTFKEMCM